MILDETCLKQLQTPCVVIDLKQVAKNIAKMQKMADENGVHLRPHIKTHKMKNFALMQIQAGAKGISCAKISEAEVMADASIQDIFVAYPLVGTLRIQRAIVLHKKIDRLILAVDSLIQAKWIEQEAKKANVQLELRLEVDTGAKRTGADCTEVVEIAKEIQKLSHVKLTGIYTFKSLVYHNHECKDAHLAGVEEGEIMDTIRKQLYAEGVYPLEISAGSTPTARSLCEHGKVDEIRPGTYIFNDYMLFKEGVASLNAIAARVYARVVHVAKEYAILDGGSKAFSTDIPLQKEPYFYKGYAICDKEHCCLSKLNEEHGFLYKEQDIDVQVNDVLSFIPVHICTTINLYNEVYVYDGKILQHQRVDARGMVV